MATLVQSFVTTLVREDGTRYEVRAMGAQRADGLWNGWLEFASGDDVRRTDPETTQSSWDDLAHWATGLEPLYLEGVLPRSPRRLDRPPHRAAVSSAAIVLVV